ncbi:MAG: 4Fe-4S dicluster domain-containing protein [Deltaproteobacteria bacterium]|nr:4Fe-4S dicluster domain-containing protein [Deltaproteobacteria bacterium]
MKGLAKKDLLSVLEGWRGLYSVLAPLRREQGDIVVDRLDSDRFTLEFGKPSLSPKGILLPQSEVTFNVEEGAYRETPAKGATLLFGVRSCDAMAILQSASFMTRDKEDIYYRSRFEDLAIVVMACEGPQNETCFCTTASTGPWLRRGFDLQFYDLGDLFFVETGSERGAELSSGEQFIDITDSEILRKIEDFREKAAAAIPVVHEVKQSMTMLQDDGVGDDFWNRFGSKCIVCGGCAFVCPTCTCFNVYDQVRGEGSGQRIRTWDACLFGGFTREASGHNPRGSQALRLKRRHEHKLRYFNETDIQEALCGCVGCGRCSDYCPVHIGTLEVARAIVQSK